MAASLGVDVPIAIAMALTCKVIAREAVSVAQTGGSGSAGRRIQHLGNRSRTEKLDALRRFALTIEKPAVQDDPTRWIDVHAPLEIVVATLEVRNALLESPFGSVDTCCWEASAALGLRLRQLGYPAEWQPCCATGCFHMVINSGGWILDPTAEQYGVGGPQIFNVAGEWPWPILKMDPNAAAVGLLELPEVPALCDEALVDLLADWIHEARNGHELGLTHGPETAIPSLLHAANVGHLIDAVYEAAGECSQKRSA